MTGFWLAPAEDTSAPVIGNREAAATAETTITRRKREARDCLGKYPIGQYWQVARSAANGVGGHTY